MRLSTYQACSLRWFFKYVAGLPEGAVSAHLIFGGAIHASLEAHYRELILGNPSPPIEHLHQAYHDKFDECDADRMSPPIPLSLLICDHVWRDPNSGKHSLLGTLSAIRATQDQRIVEA